MRRMDSSIWRMPASRPLVQTLVARNSDFSTPRPAASSPTTASELPYMGELSTIWPPALTKRASTLRSIRAHGFLTEMAIHGEGGRGAALTFAGEPTAVCAEIICGHPVIAVGA